MIGRQVGNYRLDAELGAGGSGVVYRAYDLKLQRTVAIKFLSTEGGGRLLLSEARAASGLNHPNICILYEVEDSYDPPFLVMEYVAGTSLNMLALPRGLAIDVVLHHGIQIAQALEHAHQRGVIHRDLKSANVIITPEGRAKILDFGLAKRFHARSPSESTTTTASGTVQGTLPYMAPEVLRGESADARSDLWALGVLLYEMTTGELPFSGHTVFEISAAILHGTHQPLDPQVPAGLKSVISRCVARDVSRRYQRAGQIEAALEAVVAGASRPDAPRVSPARGAARLTESRPATGELASIAVLAFTNMSADKDQEYFCDGMAEELLNALTKLSGLRVASRTSAFQFKGRAVEVGEMGRRLKVDTILEGSVRKAGNRLRVTARLVDTRSGYELWSARFDREMDDVFAVQDEIARAVAEGLRVQLTDEPVIAPTTKSVDAYHLYLKGRDYWTRRYSGFLHKAVECFEQAIAIDPTYALAHAGLADGYAVLGFWGYLPSREMMAKAEAAAGRALALGSALSEAHQSMGYVQTFFGWDAARAEDEFSQALRLNPRYAVAHGQRALLSVCLGRPDRAVVEMEQAQALDPLSPLLGWYLCIARYHARQYPQAVRECQRVLDLHPEFAVVLYHLSSALSAQGHHGAALEAAHRLAAFSGRQPYFLAHLGAISGASGPRQATEQVLAELLDRSRREYVMPVAFANLYLAMGEDEEGLGCLEQAYEDRNAPLAFLATEPFYDRLRSHPRFDGILRKIGLIATPRRIGVPGEAV